MKITLAAVTCKIRRGGRIRFYGTAISIKNDMKNQVVAEGKGSFRTAILNRPLVLNALNTNMAAKLQKLYRSWEDNSDVSFVAMKGRGRAFSAGGDIVSLYHLINQGKLEECNKFFWTLYNFIYFLGTLLKPHVAILNGITMGGGAGVSIPGTFRVATDRTIFATPETLIGFHPDAGASFYLSHLPAHLGEFLALTGEKLSGAEMAACGLATHYTSSERVPVIMQHFEKLDTDDPSIIDSSLESFRQIVHPDNMSVIHRIDAVDQCFAHDTVEEIIDALESEAARTNDAWYRSTLSRLREASPLSLKISLRSIREGRFQTLDQCLVREYRTTVRAISMHVSHDFCEGVRARVIDKDLSPRWHPQSLAEVSDDMVRHYFSPFPETEAAADLELPIKQRDAFG